MKWLVSSRAFARGLYESRILASIRKMHFKRAVEAESHRTLSVIQSLGFNVLTTEALAQLVAHDNKTLFILGSGASVNRLTDKHFHIVKSGYSIGMNAWVSHSFIPNAYSFEADNIPAPPSVEIETMSAALASRAQSHPETTLLLFRPKTPALLHRMVRVPESLKSRAFMYGRHNLLTRTDGALKKDLGPLLVNRLKNLDESPVLIDNGASVVRMIEIGLFAGFKEIVLLGIDLNASRYFWEAPDAPLIHQQMKGLYHRPQNMEHDTLETFDRPYSTLLFIQEMAQAGEREFGATVYIGTEGSSLGGKIPDYHWNLA
jgi:hypothetical protein